MTNKLAWRNVWRNQTRTIIFILAAVIGFSVAIFAINLMQTLSAQRTSDAVNTQASHLQINRTGFRDDLDITLTIKNKNAILKELDSDELVSATTCRIVLNGVLTTAENNVAGEIRGIQPTDEKNVTVLQEFIVEGEYLNDSMSNQIMVSRNVADKLKLKRKSKVIVTVQDAEGRLVGAAFRVAGIFATPSTPFDDATFLVRLEDLQQIIQVTYVHEIAIRLNNMNDATFFQKKWDKILPTDMEINTWKELLPELMAFDGFLKMVSILFTIVIVLGLAFSLISTMNMIIYERRDEIHMLRTIGLSKGKIFLTLVKESLLMMFSGIFGGVLMGSLLVVLTSVTGIRITDDGGSIGVRPIIYPELQLPVILLVVGVGMFITVLVTILPAYRAVKNDVEF